MQRFDSGIAILGMKSHHVSVRHRGENSTVESTPPPGSKFHLFEPNLGPQILDSPKELSNPSKWRNVGVSRDHVRLGLTLSVLIEFKGG